MKFPSEFAADGDELQIGGTRRRRKQYGIVGSPAGGALPGRHRKLRTYRIHLASSNIMMEPNDQYLCVVQDHQNAGGRVQLPFEDDNTLSLILSTAFLLADDDKIKDASIVSQNKRI